MIVVMLAVGALVLIVALVFRNAEAEYHDAQMTRRSDTLVVAADAMLQRYAAKMTLDPLYYLHYVDQAEAPRHCTDATSTGYDRVVAPGGAWYPDCRTWDYHPAEAFFYHPLLGGRPARRPTTSGRSSESWPPPGRTGSRSPWWPPRPSSDGLGRSRRRSAPKRSRSSPSSKRRTCVSVPA